MSRGVGGQIWNEQAENVFTAKHTDVKDVTLLRIFDCFIVVWKNHRVSGPLRHCVLTLSISQGVPLVASSGGIVPSIHPSISKQERFKRVHIEVTAALLLSLKRYSKKSITHCFSPQAFPLLISSRGALTEQVCEWWPLLTCTWKPPVRKKGATILWYSHTQGARWPDSGDATRSPRCTSVPS